MQLHVPGVKLIQWLAEKIPLELRVLYIVAQLVYSISEYFL